jgi:hypothetical protein
LFNSLHTIGVLMQEDVDAASHLLVSLGDLLRMARCVPGPSTLSATVTYKRDQTPTLNWSPPFENRWNSLLCVRNLPRSIQLLPGSLAPPKAMLYSPASPVYAPFLS